MKIYSNAMGISKDPLHKQVSGVCAGVARYFGFQRLYVRIAAVVCLFCFPVATAIAYLLAVVLLPSR